MRLWRGVSLWGKIKLLFQLIFTVISGDEDIGEEEIEAMKSQDMLSAALNDISKSFPEFKGVLIDERDQYLAEKFKTLQGKKLSLSWGLGIYRELKKNYLKSMI
jgi:pheromone shutdown protein TraB